MFLIINNKCATTGIRPENPQGWHEFGNNSFLFVEAGVAVKIYGTKSSRVGPSKRHNRKDRSLP